MHDSTGSQHTIGERDDSGMKLYSLTNRGLILNFLTVECVFGEDMVNVWILIKSSSMIVMEVAA